MARAVNSTLGTLSMSDNWKPTQEQLDHLFAELGRCLYLYQSIELSLKAILPYLLEPGASTHAPNEGFSNRRVYLDSKETLGPLIQRLKERISTDQREFFEEEMSLVVTHRNEVIHHFASQPFSRIKSENEFNQALSFLHSRRMHASPTLEMLNLLSGTFLNLLAENSEVSEE
jgi:hypothetical protein